MPFRLRSLLGLAILFSVCAGEGSSESKSPAEKPYSMENYVQQAPNKIDEPFAKEFSLEKAARFLDGVNLHWQKVHGCFTCHTNYPYLYGRPLISISGDDPAPREIRRALENAVSKKWKRGQPKGFDATAAAVSLAINDSATTKKLHPLTKVALDHLWTVQQKDGGFPWGGGPGPLNTDYDNYYAAVLVGVAVGIAPDGYAKTEAAQKGLARIRGFLAKHPPKVLHDKLMLLWAASHLDGFMTSEEKVKTIAELRGNQLADGGWSLPGLGWERWKNQYAKGVDLTIGDGYATGLCVYVLRQAGISAEDPTIKRGIAWLKSNQRESGRWFTRSTAGHQRNYLTHIGSVFAVMAIQSCTKSPPPLTVSDVRRVP